MNKTATIIITIAIIVGGGYFLLKGLGTPSPVPPPAAQAPAALAMPQVERNVVTYTDAGYAPDTLRVRAGATVTFKNEGSVILWTASDIHPAHTLYGGTALGAHCPDVAKAAFDACGGIPPGNSWPFTFNKKGAWRYHNHLAAGHTGTIIVE